ncbi:hypothetical protein [Kitasatospora terrestris]|uniref:Uncharacterized protein n=1 Tax=Kitasatospora terrestris TaxID=258051 RepID=A0ABP9DP47_9ACTN
MLWGYPAEMVVVWPAISLVGVPAVIEFLDGPGPGPSVGPVAA